MKILHLCFDGHGLNRFLPVFEHFYPNRNVWFITEDKKNAQRMTNVEADNIFWIRPWENDDYLQKILDLSQNEGIDRIVCHSILGFYLDVLNMLFKDKQYKVYWLLWGFEMYRALGYSGKMNLVDNANPFSLLSYIEPTRYAGTLRYKILGRQSYEKRLLCFLHYTDYFCFWLYEDYLLLQKYYPCSIQFRHFQYGASWKGCSSSSNMPEYMDKHPRTILLNHQSSPTGNHATLIKKLSSFNGIENYQIIVPLSYGSNLIRKYVCWKGKRSFKNNFKPLLDYMPREEYYNIVGRAEVAIFGQLRQEAAGNLDFLLTNGAKVFMREKNVLYQHYKKMGYLIFSFEHDLNSIDDLCGLSLEEKMHNAKVSADHVVYYEDFMPSLLED